MSLVFKEEVHRKTRKAGRNIPGIPRVSVLKSQDNTSKPPISTVDLELNPRK